MIKQEIATQLKRVIKSRWPDQAKTFTDGQILRTVDFTKDDRYGDLASSLPLQLARQLARPPLEIAEEIIRGFSKSFQQKFNAIEIALPGFINFTISKVWLGQRVKEINSAPTTFGRGKTARPEKIQVEFISANPTGPIHLGNGRGGFTGDVLANVLSSQGHAVRREYYINDVGNQVDILAESVIRRYFQMQGLQIDYPERCYQGEYVKDAAAKIDLGSAKLGDINRLKTKVKQKILKLMVADIQRVTEQKFKIKFHVWFNESQLYQKKTVKKLLDQLKEKDLVYRQEGALWLRTTQYGDDKDRVLIKSNRDYTYFMSDIAYHWNKFVERKFDRVIDFWGADHQGHVKRMYAVKEALAISGQLDFVIVQMVRLISGGQEVKMSKRSGTFVTLEELVDDVGLDVARFFFLMRASDTHMDFDLDLAKEKSEKNPVYYVQYAHARICSIMKKDEIRRALRKPNNDALSYDHKAEMDLIRELIKLPDLLSDIAVTYEVQRLPFYAIKLAELFHNFYTQCRVIEDGRVNYSRLALIKATRIVLQQSLKLMGVTAPIAM
ncbi:MAG: arginine--tRNA ligase [Patescibacteria group bacterium]|jgi:arginyl-tRNA synthetase